MLGFCGTYSGTIDDKGRLSIPSKIRPGDPETSQKKGIPAADRLIVTQGFDGCLSLYPESEWEKVQQRLETKSFAQKDLRFLNRRLHQFTSIEKIDRSGRIHIPEILRKLAGLGKEVLVLGANQTIEIWDPDQYEKYMDNYGRTLEEVAEGLYTDDPNR
ncbi:MAG: division/cell wall cluster transcriptional repressor MraZ [candidate division Zixibacteria bacterium]|nr:division/cell wall cluster transcriptional repressor MraZ [candidate division Zixibacteria bacterium]